MESSPPQEISLSPVKALLERLLEANAANNSGEVASYIPELSTADPDLFGICLVTAGGAVYEVGDTRQEFTIQSISKPLTFALALEANGEEAVREHVDVEPSGEAFNSITLKPGSGIPLNPMVNAGAIATASLIRPIGFDRPIDRILNQYWRPFARWGPGDRRRGLPLRGQKRPPQPGDRLPDEELRGAGR